MTKHCTCAACATLNERYADDPVLLAMYRKKLLIVGWAGETDRVEAAYVQAHSRKATRARDSQRELVGAGTQGG